MSGWRKRTIMEMAREAGAVFPADGSYHSFERHKDLEAFAELVRADEREACAKLIKSAQGVIEALAQLELNAAIVQTLLPRLYSIIDRLLDGQDKALVIEARRVLPKAYENSFEKGKGV